MRVPRIFVDAALESPGALDLPSSQSHYVRNVLRGRVGQSIVLFNGRGGEHHGRITDVKRSVVSISLDAFVEADRESPIELHIALGVTKRDAFNEALQKSTELGASRITPVVTEFNSTATRSLDKRFQHWEGVIKSAAEQCERNRLPTLHPLTPFQDLVATADAGLRLIAHPGGGFAFRGTPAPSSVLIATGPEGGFSFEEVELAVAAGFERVGLGPRILRAETAPLALLSIAQQTWGDLRPEDPPTATPARPG